MATLNENKLVLRVKKLDKQAKLPTKAHETDGGWDLYCLKETVVSPGHTIPISTGISIEIPEGYVGVIHDRSSLGSQSLTVFGGVIDSGYSGEIKVIVHNTFYPNPEYVYTFNAGDKIAQILILPVPECEIEEVDELKESKRGKKGFGEASGK